jgi:hypothetical protein
MGILACGPYIGSFEQEILTFRPYCRWLVEAGVYENIYINTHSNRFFLYDFVPEENLLPIYENLSRDEKNQEGYIHNKIKSIDFGIIVKKLKEDIIEREKCTKKEIDIQSLSYVKSTPPYSIFKKIFEDIKIENVQKNERIVFIPSTIEKDKYRMEYIYTYLSRLDYDVEVIGDEKTYFRKDNNVLRRIDYFENGWKTNVRKITESKAVICPASYWTVISNLQSKPVFSWGENISQYREGGIYNFGNDCFTFPTSNDTDVKIILKMINHFLRR